MTAGWRQIDDVLYWAKRLSELVPGVPVRTLIASELAMAVHRYEVIRGHVRGQECCPHCAGTGTRRVAPRVVEAAE